MSTTKLSKLSLQVESTPRGLSRVERMLGSVKNIWNLGEDAYKKIWAGLSEALRKTIQSNGGDANTTVTVAMQCAGNSCEFTIRNEDKEGRKDAPVTMTFETGTTR